MKPTIERKTFLFQINVTRDCNLRCTHCYISSDKKAQSKFMTEDQFIEVFRQIADFLRKDEEGQNRIGMADIHVIGGEPTMLGLPFFESTLPMVRELLGSISGKEIKLSIVTNLVTQDALGISRLFDAVATSYEFETRFVNPKTGKPKPALERMWQNNVRTLQNEGRNVAVTMAITKPAADIGARHILDHFYDNGFYNIHLGFFIPSGDGLRFIDDVFPPFEATTEFLKTATDWYLERRLADEKLYVNPIESMIDAIYHDTAIDDIVCPIIPGSLDIDWDGETVTCIEAGGEVGFDSLGNIFTHDIEGILAGAKYRRERAKAISPKPHCIGCDEFQSCQSACGILHGFWNGEGECPGFKGFIKHVRALVEAGVKPKPVAIRERATQEAMVNG